MSKKKIGIGTFLACVCIAFAVGQFGFNSSANQAEIVDCEIESHYKYGDEFNMPSGNVSYKDKEKKAEKKYLVFPSGKANESETIILSEEGKYEVVFEAKFNGMTVTAKETFIVNKRLIAVNDEKSSAELIDNAINVSLVPDDVFTYNKALDLASISEDKPLISIEFKPNVIGTADASRVYVRLTDLYDENNYVTIVFKNDGQTWAEDAVYVSAGAANQPSIGVENIINPDKAKVHVDSTAGAVANSSMVGKPHTSMEAIMDIYFNYEERAIYLGRERYSGGKKQMAIDLDDENYFGMDLWNGFTTGEVKMTVFAGNYKSPTCNFVISQIGGETNFDAMGDQESPILTVDSGYDIDKLPIALVGKPYKTFEATAFDKYDGILKVSTAAYYKYYSENPVKLSIEDGAFIPTKEGTYVIEYTAEDFSGNVATECIKIKAVEGEGLQVELKDVAKETDTGVAVKAISGIDYTDNSGDVTYSLKAVNHSSDEEIKINEDTLEFIPMSDGDWEITVIAKDYVSTVEKTFSVKANHTTQPQVYDSANIQKYLILGAQYSLPKINGYDFSSGKGVASEMEVFVTESGSAEKRVEKGQYIPEKAGVVDITYRLTVDGKSCEKSFSATVVDVGYTGDLDLSKYFVVTEGSVEAESNATSVTYSASKDAKMEFVNFVQVKKLAFSFQVGEQNSYNKINIYLTDIATGKQVKFSYRRAEGEAMFSINDGAEAPLEASFDGLDRNFSLEFSNDIYQAIAGDSLSTTVEKYLDGSKFAGFTDSVAYFTIEMEGVSGGSQLVVSNLNAQSINNTRIDRFAPEIIVDTKSGDRGVNEEIELTGAFAYDTLDPSCTLTLDVTGPNGEYVKDKEGIVLDGTQDPTKNYTLKLKDYGDYTIRYVATDGKGKTTEYVYAITAKDVTSPIITLKNHKTSARKNATIKVAKIDAKDDVTDKCTVVSYVFDPDGVFLKVEDGKFEATMEGTYTVRYMVFDESGNYAFASYEIDVK